MTTREVFELINQYSPFEKLPSYDQQCCGNIEETPLDLSEYDNIHDTSIYQRKTDGRLTYHYTTNDNRRTSKSYPRVVVENELGISLKDDEVVHHKDEDPSNNDITNLQVLTRSEHGRLHKPCKYFNKLEICDVCGNYFIWTRIQQERYYMDIRRGRRRIKTCSFKCRSYAGRMRQLGRDI